MGKLRMLFTGNGINLELEADHLQELDFYIGKLADRGFFPVCWNTTQEKDLERIDKAIENSHYDGEDKPVDFCPIHGSSKKWKDKNDGGHYCGEKVDGKWCGYAENDAGVMRRPPRTMPDYIQF